MWCSLAPAYYFYVQFASTSNFTPLPAKFDVNALRNKTVYYFVSDNGPSQMAPGDSFPALLSEIRLAAKAWNDVQSSDLRIAFGGLTSAGTAQNSPGIDVVFDDDIPPGVVALAGPTSTAAAAPGQNFVPVLRSTLHLPRDFRTHPSYSEDLFGTLVHELGHTLGLQHTLTSAVMSTSLTRSTTRSKPLADDDIAAVSVLYPTGSFLAATASISGRVTAGGAGVNLASVVAISPTGPTVSTLTNPDGSYNLQGVPPGQYWIYVHPLPPPSSTDVGKPAGIEPPKGADGNPLPLTTYFDTVFYPGVKDTTFAQAFFLAAGDAKTGLNFSVSRRTLPAVWSVLTYGYYGNNGVHPAPLVTSGDGAAKSIGATGNGLLNGNTVSAGLSVSVLGQAGANIVGSPRFWVPGYIYFGVAPTFGANTGPRHLVFSQGGDLYVLPSALLLVNAPAPNITSATPATDDRGARAVLIAGTNLDANTRFYFDGAPAGLIRQNPDGTFLVTPPPATPGYRAAIVALNGDGQSSLFQSPNPPAFLYDPADGPFVSVNPSSLPAGSEAMVEIIGVNTGFADGLAAAGFGSSDIAVRRLWVTGPNRMIANVSVSPNAAVTATEFTAVSGLQVNAQPFGFQILAPNPRQVVMTPLASSVPAGGVATIAVSNLSAGASSIALTVNDQRATVFSAANGQITFQVPASVSPGPAVVKLQLPTGDPVFPIILAVDPPPPAITGAFSSPGVTADLSHPAFRGSLTGFQVSGLSSLSDFSALKVTVGGVDHSVIFATPQNGGLLVQILLDPSVPAGDRVAVTLTYNGSLSQPFTIAVR